MNGREEGRAPGLGASSDLSSLHCQGKAATDLWNASIPPLTKPSSWLARRKRRRSGWNEKDLVFFSPLHNLPPSLPSSLVICCLGGTTETAEEKATAAAKQRCWNIKPRKNFFFFLLLQLMDDPTFSRQCRRRHHTRKKRRLLFLLDAFFPSLSLLAAECGGSGCTGKGGRFPLKSCQTDWSGIVKRTNEGRKGGREAIGNL